MANFISFVAALSIAAFVVVAGADLDHGMEMVARAYDSVCWYEGLKQFPHTQTKLYNQCGTTMSQRMAGFEKNADHFKKYPDQKNGYFGGWMKKNAMPRIPSSYNDACGALIDDPDAAPPADESEAMNDGGDTYPFKALAHCLMHALRSTKGAAAIDSVKAERTVGHKDWMPTILDRENEFRARHGVDALVMEKTLNDQAQKWADYIASRCLQNHSKNDDPDRQFEGQTTGESLAMGMTDDKEVSAYQAADGWYEEIRDYPYPGGYQEKDDDENDTLFKKIGHFTQSVWKGSKKVGYGYAYNPECKDKKQFNRYVVARYSPPGNVEGNFPENVNPPKD